MSLDNKIGEPIPLGVISNEPNDVEEIVVAARLYDAADEAAENDNPRKELAALKADLAQIKASVSQIGHSTKDIAVGSAEKAVADTRSVLRRNPKTSLLTAAALGFVVGALMSR
ncbi:hypothetical protein IFT84_03815 [Rhizobium sp. CFBP 8762]|uniref:hypothetical protein n=1 Tax=Rhizobium sp. CFBP 8762 TaxID=2775279 RepID=UPI00177EE0A8|nr:hypothetical protein [Rhizobium sp. CFBP 8762]MBD8553642.1 hypothetical protein [Rhizobium sp. CFBP 8762]